MVVHGRRYRTGPLSPLLIHDRSGCFRCCGCLSQRGGAHRWLSNSITVTAVLHTRICSYGRSSSQRRSQPLLSAGQLHNFRSLSITLPQTYIILTFMILNSSSSSKNSMKQNNHDQLAQPEVSGSGQLNQLQQQPADQAPPSYEHATGYTGKTVVSAPVQGDSKVQPQTQFQAPMMPTTTVYHYVHPATGARIDSLLPPDHPEMVCLQQGHQPETRYGVLGVLAAIFWFPLGVGLCLLDRNVRCRRCGAMIDSGISCA